MESRVGGQSYPRALLLVIPHTQYETATATEELTVTEVTEGVTDSSTSEVVRRGHRDDHNRIRLNARDADDRDAALKDSWVLLLTVSSTTLVNPVELE